MSELPVHEMDIMYSTVSGKCLTRNYPIISVCAVLSVNAVANQTSTSNWLNFPAFEAVERRKDYHLPRK